MCKVYKILEDQASLFPRQIPSLPPYWQKFIYEVVAMVKLVGIPASFMTLSCADLRWPELFQIIGNTQVLDLTEEKIEAKSYNERCSMLNLNPAIVAKHFQLKVETFFYRGASHQSKSDWNNSFLCSIFWI